MEMVHHHDVAVELSTHLLTAPHEIETLRTQLQKADVSHPVLRPNQMLIVCMPRIKLSYIRSECKHRIPMSLL
jgi:hypothetical protein